MMDALPPGHPAKPPSVQAQQSLANAGSGSSERINPRESDGSGQRLAKVEIYTRRFCADSMRTKGLFDRKNIQYNEYLIDTDIVNSSAMSQRTEGLASTPQVFIDGNLIGGLQQVMELEQAGDLNLILGIRA